MIKFSEWKTRASLAANTGCGRIWIACALLQVAVVGQKEQINLSVTFSSGKKSIFKFFCMQDVLFQIINNPDCRGINMHN